MENNYTPLWKYSDVSAYTSLAEATLRQLVMRRKIPYIKIGRSVRFNPEDIDQWLNAHRREVSP